MIIIIIYRTHVPVRPLPANLLHEWWLKKIFGILIGYVNTDLWTDRQRQAERERETDRQTDRDRQTPTHTHTQTERPDIIILTIDNSHIFIKN